MKIGAIIKYNNEEIAAVEENDSKILDCNGKYMNGNIEVTFGLLPFNN